MNISGIRPYAGFYDYNSIENLKQAQDDMVASEGQRTVQAVGQNQTACIDEVTVRANQTYDAIDYAKEYQPDAEYEMKGADSDPLSLDMEKAISDMQKDQVLQQYQFFIGENLAQGNVVSLGTANMDAFRINQNFDI